MRLICTLLLFSGRPNPEWTVEDESVKQAIMERIRLLPARSDTPEQPSKLGYQGCRLQTDDQYWSVREGIVRQESPGQPRGFSDPDRQLEKMLLQTAPSAYSALAYSLLSSEF